jgi:competence protein ComEA
VGESRRVTERVRALLAERQAHGWVPGGADVPPVRDEPPARWRIDPGRRAAASVGLCALIAAVLAVGWLLLSRPRAETVQPATHAVSSSPGGGSASSPGVASPSPVVLLVVDVVGKVTRPGIYQVPTGSRVDDAVRAAGGALPGTDLSALNLARKIADGEQIAVGVPAAPATNASVPAGPVDLNSATVAQLDALPGVGPVLAQHIVEWRDVHGRFASIDQLRQVSGIGDAKLADLRSLVTV